MCKVCDKFIFIVESLEQLCSIEELLRITLAESIDRGEPEIGERIREQVKANPSAAKTNFIGHLAATYCEKHDISPVDFLMTFQMYLSYGSHPTQSEAVRDLES